MLCDWHPEGPWYRVFKKRKTVRLSVSKVAPDGRHRARDLVVVEEPLTVLWQGTDGPVERLSATMRTPGEDNELAAGLLFSEGLLHHQGELEVLSFCASGGPNELNRLRAALRLSHAEGRRRLARRPSAGLPQSACGLCSFDELSNPKALLDWAAAQRPEEARSFSPPEDLLHQALDLLQREAPVFASTGASHAVVLVNSEGRLLSSAEDVGRHNACDKAIGKLFLNDKREQRFRFPEGTGVLFSSRLSFELASKAVRAGAAWMASVGAPTHLAVELAQRLSLPTMGFVSLRRHNVYVI